MTHLNHKWLLTYDCSHMIAHIWLLTYDHKCVTDVNVVDIWLLTYDCMYMIICVHTYDCSHISNTLSTTTDDRDRPLCPYPLSSNHCLWEWSDAGGDRDSFRVRGFTNKVRREKLWNHVERECRRDAIRSEIRARYDILSHDTIINHANIHVDPSTGHMLQTLQMI